MPITDLTIRGLGPQADGISQGPRGRVFVERALPGDRVRARLFRDEEGLSRATVTEILNPSPLRQKPPCPHYDRCGNCTLQHLNADYYRQWKLDLVRNAFLQQRLQPRQWKAPVFLGAGNRRRLNFSAYKQNRKVGMGYYRRRSQQITDIASCLVADPRLMALREPLKAALAPFINERGTLDIFLQIVGDDVDMLLTGPLGRQGKPDDRLLNALAERFESSPVLRISWRAHEKDGPQILLKKAPLVARFGDLEVALPPDAFLQPTREGEQALVQAISQGLPPKGRFADLFSGCGTFSGPLLKQGSVDAYEQSLPAVKALSRAALKRPLQVFRRDLFRQPLPRQELNRYDAVIFDPPRGGCPEQAEAMASAKVRTLIGVSCNPATFARDARLLCEGGYRLQSVQVVDQFHWSHHVEMVGVFAK